MSSLLATRDAIVSVLSADARLDGVQVSAHGGEFKEDDLRRYSKHAPALVVALLSCEPELEGGAIIARAMWCVIAICNDRPAMTRDRGAIALTDTALRVLLPAFYNAAPSSRLRNFKARNVFGPKIDAAGVAMWSILAAQQIELLDDESTAVDFKTFAADWVQPGDSAPIASDEVGDPL